MFPGMEAIACPNLAVPAQVMRHVVQVESGANPFAIGVVGGRLVRQPKTLEEARATAEMLETKGYNYSLGVAQVNRVNFRRYGLDSYEKTFDPCTNLSAGAKILAGCYASAGGDWGKAFSCYYSGNFVTGFRSGYVQKVFDSISRGMTVEQTSTAPSTAIPLHPATASPNSAASAPRPSTIGARRAAEAPPTTTAASRISMRVVPVRAPEHPAQMPTVITMPSAPSASTAGPVVQTNPADQPLMSLPSVNAEKPEVFVPQVRYPNAPQTPAKAAPTDRSGGDGAFVF